MRQSPIIFKEERGFWNVAKKIVSGILGVAILAGAGAWLGLSLSRIGKDVEEIRTALFDQEVRITSAEKQIPHVARFLATVRLLTERMEGRASAAEIVEVARIISQYCEAYESIGLNESLIFGLIERESAFDPKAVSWANAYGLTQVLLPTAAPHLRDMGHPNPTADLLLNPVVNVEVGIRELIRLRKYWMAEGFDSWPVALTSYFWGPRPTWALLLEKGRANLPSLEYGTGVLRLASAWREKGLQ